MDYDSTSSEFPNVNERIDMKSGSAPHLYALARAVVIDDA
jgi:hypothetical protein